MKTARKQRIHRKTKLCQWQIFFGFHGNRERWQTCNRPVVSEVNGLPVCAGHMQMAKGE